MQGNEGSSCTPQPKERMENDISKYHLQFHPQPEQNRHPRGAWDKLAFRSTIKAWTLCYSEKKKKTIQNARNLWEEKKLRKEI